jgi:hypothetical protein
MESNPQNHVYKFHDVVLHSLILRIWGSYEPDIKKGSNPLTDNVGSYFSGSVVVQLAYHERITGTQESFRLTATASAVKRDGYPFLCDDALQVAIPLVIDWLKRGTRE